MSLMNGFIYFKICVLHTFTRTLYITEGNVFYSNQEYLNNGDDDEAPNLRSRASVAFRDFIRNFKDVAPDDVGGDLSIETCIYRYA